MTTTEAADRIRDVYDEEERFDEYEMEKKVFNTGPCASKTLPIPFQQVIGNSNNNSGGLNRPPSVNVQLDANSPEPAQINNLMGQIPNNASNESSNLSCGGGSCSDKEMEAIQNNAKANCIPVMVEKKQPARKRRLKNPANPDTPRPVKEKKITEYTQLMKKSPTRAYMQAPNGDSLSNDLVPLCTSPIPTSSGPNNLSMNRTPNNVALLYSSSDSNQSPPSSSSSKMEAEVQTDALADFEAAGSLKQMQEDFKKDQYKNELVRMNNELKQNLEIQRSKVRASRETIKSLLIKQSRMERKQAKERCMEASLRIGQFKPTRRVEHFKDEWTDGYAMEDINKRLLKINSERNEIVNATQNLRKRKPLSKELKKQSNDMPSTSNASYTDDGFLRPEPPKEMTAQEFMEQEEIYRLRKEHLKREESDLQAERDRLERERNIHIREMKRVQYEEQSRFKDHELLNNRYLLLALLGKGGFSEVWRAFDLDENRYVACKIHHVNKDWKEDKKANYVKHAMREKDIHKSLDHPRIVRLFDLFTIDNDSFCTVLDYCDGNDLDFYLKQHKQIPEKEARCIMMQVVSALKYLGERRQPIIHYDLKPANILLQSGTTGEIKLTDFGLSKQVENADDGDSIDLTSQGAGTYWYLPPETFQHNMHGGPPKISSKVDVWSVGVIFYQCIYGKRPFGHERTQQQILEEKTILNASEVTFPSKPPVSVAAQDFIRRCLQYRKEERADVNELFRHELFKPRGQKSLQPPSPSSMKTMRGADSTDD
uniref:Protein kinase domain-containing protein n=1 Tax=Ditylenchus dipsaci TaxID=166011 RepID=A0A915EVB0_9BILA